MDAIRLFLCGDVMTARGIDQILASPSDPAIHEGYLEGAEEYVVHLHPRGLPGIALGMAQVRDFLAQGDRAIGSLQALERFHEGAGAHVEILAPAGRAGFDLRQPPAGAVRP